LEQQLEEEKARFVIETAELSKKVAVHSATVATDTTDLIIEGYFNCPDVFAQSYKLLYLQNLLSQRLKQPPVL
jgi:hypothetical protein